MARDEPGLPDPPIEMWRGSPSETSTPQRNHNAPIFRSVVIAQFKVAFGELGIPVDTVEQFVNRDHVEGGLVTAAVAGHGRAEDTNELGATQSGSAQISLLAQLRTKLRASDLKETKLNLEYHPKETKGLSKLMI
jgi:hypothetical protein